MVSIMVVIIEGAIMLCMPVVLRTDVFITKALYGHTPESATYGRAAGGIQRQDESGRGIVPSRSHDAFLFSS